MKVLPKILMILSCLLFAFTLFALISSMQLPVLVTVLVLLSLCLIAFTFISVTGKEPDQDSRRRSNLLQQSEAKYKEYKRETDEAIKRKDERISSMAAELQEFKRGL